MSRKSFVRFQADGLSWSMNLPDLPAAKGARDISKRAAMPSIFSKKHQLGKLS